MNKHKQFIKDAYNEKFGSMCSKWKETILKSYPEFEYVEMFKIGDWIIDKGAKYSVRRIIGITKNTVIQLVI